MCCFPFCHFLIVFSFCACHVHVKTPPRVSSALPIYCGTVFIFIFVFTLFNFWRLDLNSSTGFARWDMTAVSPVFVAQIPPSLCGCWSGQGLRITSRI